MEWNVYYFDINKKKIEVFNIFDHCSFLKWIKKDLKNIKDKDEFAKALKSNLMYYYWAKAEWEVIIAPWVGGDRDKCAEKIDVYDQVMLNWDTFVDYVWCNKKELLENNENE